MREIIDLLGRVFLSTIFLFEAYDNVRYAKFTKSLMTEYGLTWNQDLVLYGGAAVLTIGGIMMLMGYRLGLAALLLLLYYVPITLIVHSFWNDPVEIRRQESIYFMQSLAIIGGVLMASVNTSGAYSIKRLLSTTKVKSR